MKAEGPKRQSSLSLMHLEDVVEALQADGRHVDAHDVRLVLHLERAEGARQVGRLEVLAEARLVDDDNLPRGVTRASHVRTQNSQKPGSAARPLCQ